MNVGVYPYPHGDPLLIDKIVNEFLSQGKFDKLRKECMSDADTKPAYQNLQQRVENTVTQFLKKQVWRPDLNKNQLRDSLRKHILESKFFDAGINRIVDQVVNPNVLGTVFLPEVEEVVYNYLSIPKPFDKTQKRDEKLKSSGKDDEHKTLQENQKYDKYGREKSESSESHQKENADEDYKLKDIFEKTSSKDYENSNDVIKTESQDEVRKIEEKFKSEPEEEVLPVKTEIPSDESQESLNRMEGLRINEPEAPPIPDSDDSAPLEINEKSMSESRDSEDSIMNQMSPISQGRLTPDLEEELPEVKPSEEKPPEEKPAVKEEEKKPLTFIGRIPKIKREDSESSKSSKTREDTPKKEKLDVKHIYSSDESDSSKSYGKSDSDEMKKQKSEKSNREDRKRDESEKKHKDRKRDSSKDRKSSKDRSSHKDHKRERSRERHKKNSTSSSSSQRERSSSHHKSSHRHKDSKSRRKEEEKKKSKSTDDHGKERNKKEDRRSTDRDSNERERGRSSGANRTDGENRKREKEQTKTEDEKGENGQNAEEMEKESDVVVESLKTASEDQNDSRRTPVKSEGGQNDPDKVLDFQELLKLGALTRMEFPKLMDDFYVKFNSTGFRYFEDWEQSKLDCEEEFKEFVDEAENNLSLLSDDESDLEIEKKFEEENEKTIKNLLKGLGNFRRSVMFDPNRSEFYRWTNNKFYQKFRKKGEGREESTEKTESDESVKENIDRGGGDKRRAMHLKLINRYKRKAMRMGKTRRRQRKPGGWGGIKEKNENAVFRKMAEEEEEAYRRVMLVADCSSLVERENSTVPNGVNSLSDLGVSLPESPEESEDWSGKQKSNESGKKTNGKLTESLQLHLPPSPDSDDVDTNNGIGPNIATVPRKRVSKTEGGTPKKQTRRNYSQKYESQDLYKPRPILNGSRTRGREKGLERELVDTGSPVLR